MRHGIVVGMDGSPHAANALRWGCSEGIIRDCPVRAVFVWSNLDQEKLDRPFDPRFGEEDARKFLGSWVEDAIGDGAGQASVEVVCDLPVPGLVEASRDAELLVVGARGRGGFPELLLGSTTTRVLDAARCPTAVIRELAPMDAPVVVGVEDTDESRAALRWAVAEAATRHVPLRVVAAWERPWWMAEGGTLPPHERASRAAEAAVRAVPEKVTVRTHIVEGDPTAALVEEARDAGLIVVGSRQVGPMGRILGSVPLRLANHAEVPVVVVPS